MCKHDWERQSEEWGPNSTIRVWLNCVICGAWAYKDRKPKPEPDYAAIARNQARRTIK